MKPIAPFGLRIRPELKQQIAVSASQNGRSMNAEIIFQLERVYGANEKSEVTA
ncbi:Arc family DNA-binding protein [Brucella anthropi]|uniref:Arc family DNA-binding protein n=1 Tax=Brucella anthropi TaxID=529 RepID=UPI0009B8F3AF|nr:Arc family DNA-binding protein [Brucella anthropi]